jgi:hypothetical protein
MSVPVPVPKEKISNKRPSRDRSNGFLGRADTGKCSGMQVGTYMVFKYFPNTQSSQERSDVFDRADPGNQP